MVGCGCVGCCTSLLYRGADQVFRRCGQPPWTEASALAPTPLEAAQGRWRPALLPSTLPSLPSAWVRGELCFVSLGMISRTFALVGGPIGGLASTLSTGLLGAVVDRDFPLVLARVWHGVAPLRLVGSRATASLPGHSESGCSRCRRMRLSADSACRTCPCSVRGNRSPRLAHSPKYLCGNAIRSRSRCWSTAPGIGCEVRRGRHRWRCPTPCPRCRPGSRTSRFPPRHWLLGRSSWDSGTSTRRVRHKRAATRLLRGLALDSGSRGPALLSR
jgi:hypothetical protein